MNGRSATGTKLNTSPECRARKANNLQTFEQDVLQRFYLYLSGNKFYADILMTKRVVINNIDFHFTQIDNLSISNFVVTLFSRTSFWLHYNIT